MNGTVIKSITNDLSKSITMTDFVYLVLIGPRHVLITKIRILLCNTVSSFLRQCRLQNQNGLCRIKTKALRKMSIAKNQDVEPTHERQI